ncbi:MAG: hypothetical protein JXR86_14710 [Spirochaetales bacterium]|nr:hypothetical protein [Spirochaetales bacterium]
MKLKYFLLISLVAAQLISCRGNADKEPEVKNREENTVNLTVNNQIRVPVPEVPVIKNDNVRDNQAEAGEPGDILPQQSRFFLSGRTDLLALPVEKRISSRGFSIGVMYNRYLSSAENRKIIDVCTEFLSGLKGRNFKETLVLDERVEEIRSFWEYYIGEIKQFDAFQFGDPRSSGREYEVNILLQPDNRAGRIYVISQDEIWKISGLEIDLKDVLQGAVEVEKWVPSVNPFPMGY